MPFHKTRRWSVADASDVATLADKLTQYSWCLCNGFRLGGYLFLNDSLSEDGAAEFAIVREADGTQVESVTFGWMSPGDAEALIRRVLAGELSEEYGRVPPSRWEPADEHDRCHHCM